MLVESLRAGTFGGVSLPDPFVIMVQFVGAWRVIPVGCGRFNVVQALVGSFGDMCEFLMHALLVEAPDKDLQCLGGVVASLCGGFDARDALKPSSS